MMNDKYIKSVLTAMIVGSFFVGNGALAESSFWDKAAEKADQAGKVISETGEKAGKVISKTGEKVGDATSKAAQKVDKFVDDSTLTARVKAALADDSFSTGFDVSVTTREGIVTLSGFVPSVDAQVRAIQIAGAVEGVKSVSDKLNIRADKEVTIRDYAQDAIITSEIKTKFLKEENLPLTGISVETVDGIVQLFGVVKTPEQVYLAEMLAKQVKGVKSVKNDLSVRY